jgi:hypothetical protein
LRRDALQNVREMRRELGLVLIFFRRTAGVFLERLRELAGVCIAHTACDFGDIEFAI